MNIITIRIIMKVITIKITMKIAITIFLIFGLVSASARGVGISVFSPPEAPSPPPSLLHLHHHH